MKNLKNYMKIVEHIENCFDKYGDTYKGMDWPKSEDVFIRYRVMLELIKNSENIENFTLLDLGCGTGKLNEYLVEKKSHLPDYSAKLNYSGLDISEKFIEIARKKFPENDFYCLDLLDTTTVLPTFDFVIMNGVFTEKRDLSFEDMFNYFKRLVRRVSRITKTGFAFNVMSKQVDWERDDLFHLPIDDMADFLVNEISRNFVVRNDYGLYEYTTYVYV